MWQNPPISQEELQDLLSVHLLNNFLAIGQLVGEITPYQAIPGSEEYQLLQKIFRQVSQLMAAHLLDNDSSVPLFSNGDFDTLLTPMLDFIFTGQENDSEEARATVGSFLKHIFVRVNMSESLGLFLRPNENPYDTWRIWIEHILDAASESGIAPAEVLLHQGLSDQITRELVTKKEYISRLERLLEQAINPNVLIDSILETIEDGLQRLAAQIRIDEAKPRIMASYYARLERGMAKVAQEADRIYQTD